MACYFLIDTYINEKADRTNYDEYIRLVKPIVESFNGKYIVRTDEVKCLSSNRMPQRVIVIKFPTRENLNECFTSKEYRTIMNKRIDTVDARGIIVEGMED